LREAGGKLWLASWALPKISATGWVLRKQCQNILYYLTLPKKELRKGGEGPLTEHSVRGCVNIAALDQGRSAKVPMR